MNLKSALKITRFSFWKYIFKRAVKMYIENGEAIPKLGENRGAFIETSASLRTPENIFLGKDVLIGPDNSLWPGLGKIIIKDNVLLGPNVQIFASNHGISKDILINKQPLSPQDIIIEEDCWIGAGSIVLAGVTIRRGTVVAAGSVVTKSTSPYSIIAGIPAKEISSRNSLR
ncbi:acyltransferase [Bacillus salinus]|uniref:acyltransferase n=1 Tax=Bacillus sp. HMF5848 TaxID=2495421 RepID=UPI00163B5320|nr:acyltransferase [Bacillus sp. HMF5848]